MNTDKKKELCLTEITENEYNYIKENFTNMVNERQVEKKDSLGIVHLYVSSYADEYVDLYLSKKPEKTTPQFIVEVSEYGRKIKLCISLAYFDENDNPLRQEYVKQPRKFLERLMRHYPPHENIYEREMVKNNAIKIGSELTRKDEPVSVKPKVRKI